MSYSPSLITLAQWLAGIFENKPQAMDQPVWFVHLRLWHRPLPHLIQGRVALFAEQANALYLDQPYRQRIMLLQESDEGDLQAQYLAFRQPDRFSGAGANPALLADLTAADVEWLPGCVLSIAQHDGTYVARPEPGSRCYFQYAGKTRQVILGFDAQADRFSSYDRGVDPDTGESLWGALMGPYEFHKQDDFGAELP